MITRNALLPILGLLFLAHHTLFAQFPHDDAGNDAPPGADRVINAMRTIIAPVLDGEVLSDPAWENAVPTSRFWQTTPNEGTVASEETEVRIVYTDEVLFCGVVCYDRTPDGIVVSESTRDAPLDETDCFQIIFDTFHDKQNGFLFGTNPAGIEYDAQVTKEGEGRFGSGSGSFNLNWDAAWQVRTRISDIGWSAEFAIPFRTLRYASMEEQVWGVNFQRNIRRHNENAFWAALPRQFNLQKVSLAGSLRGLQNLRQNNLKATPYTLSQVNHDFANNLDADWNADVGFDLKYSLTPSLTLDATYNTDFAQVEVDEQQINLNRFNLFFPEKRPFFLENAGFFSVGTSSEVELFFSRRIGISEDDAVVPILGGLRLSGKAAGLNLGMLSMQTESVTPDGIQANNFSVARVTKEFPNRSALGGIVVNRQGMGALSGDNDYNRAFGIDGRLGFGEYTQIQGYLAATSTPDLDGDEYAYHLSARYDSEAWLLTGSYSEVSEAFNPEVGFLRRAGYRNPAVTIFHRYRPKKFLGLLELRPHTSYSGFWNFEGFQETGFWHIDNHWEWKNGYEFHTGINFTREGVTEDFEISPEDTVRTGTYDHAELQLVANTNEGAWASFRVRAVFGGFFGGDRVALTPTLKFRLGETFNTAVTLFHNNVNLPTGGFTTNLLQARVSYSLTPRIFWQGLFQYNDRDDIWSMNLRFGMLHAANTGLFIVYNDSRVREIETRRYTTQFRSLIFKYSRVFDLLR